MKSPFNDGKFNRRNFCVEQAPSAEVNYNDSVHTQHSTADSKGNQTQEILSHVALQITVLHKSLISQINL